MTAIPADGLVVRIVGGVRAVHTEALTARVRIAPAPAEIVIALSRSDLPGYELDVHLGVVFSKVLAWLGYLRLHAAAAAWRGSASVFLGDKGAGKSTITMALGRAGWTILADDDVMARRSRARLVVSGCDETIRLTARTERHFFPTPLAIVPEASGGELKKQVLASALFPSTPYREAPVERLLVTRVGETFRVDPATRRDAVTTLLGTSGRAQRFGDAEDYRGYVDLLARLLQGVPLYRLTLSRDLRDLDRLVEFLRSGASPPPGGSS